MSILAPLTDLVVSTLPAYPAERVAVVTGTVAEAVLWSGPAQSRAAVETQSGYVVVFLLLALAAMAWGLRALGRGTVEYDSITGEESYAPSAAVLPALAMCLTAFIAAGWGWHYSAKAATGGVVVTASRVVVMDNETERTDIPAASVTRVDRANGTVTLRVAGRREVVLVPETDKAEALDRALDALTTRVAMN